MSLTCTRRLFLSTLFLTSTAGAAERITGGWSAVIGGRAVGGAWAAEPNEDRDAAWGSWSLLDKSGRRLASGTWGARKVAGKWEGQWQAAVPSRGSYSGSWTAGLELDGSAPMVEMLRHARKQVVNGQWRAATGQSGSWAIQAGSDE